MNDKPDSPCAQIGIDLHSRVSHPGDQISAIAGALDFGVGSAAKAAQAIEEETRRKAIEASYGFLGNRELEKLQAQMAGIGDIARSIPELDPGYAAKQAAEQFAKVGYPGLDDLAMREAALRAATQGFEVDHPEEPMVISRPWMPPPIEDTPLGRAVLESAAHSREVANKVESLVGLVARLKLTLVENVLPAWIEKVKADQKNAKESFDHAARQLGWAIAAVFASAAVTVLATWWQISVTRDIDRENTEQQKRTEQILRDQLAHQQKLAEQQAKDAAAMLEAISALKTINRQAEPRGPTK